MKKVTIISLFSSLLLVSGVGISAFAQELPLTQDVPTSSTSQDPQPTEPTSSDPQPTEPTSETTEPTSSEPQPTEPTSESTSETSTEPTSESTSATSSSQSTSSTSTTASSQVQSTDSVTPSPSKPISDDKGNEIIGTTNGQVLIKNKDGQTKTVDAETIGAKKQKDGTVQIKDKDGKLKVLPKTGEKENRATSLFGAVLSLLGISGLLYSLKNRKQA